MSVPRKKFHAITVDGASYRWLVRRIVHQDGFVEGLELRIVMKEKSNPAIVGFVNTSKTWHDPKARPPFVFLPKHIAAIIRHACSEGWHPQKTRSDFRVDNPQRFIDKADGG